MKYFTALLFLLFMLQLKAQIKISDNLSLTNHFQTHILTTIGGDKFIGRTIDMDSGMVVFKIRSANEIVLDFADVDSISVAGKDWSRILYLHDFAERTSLSPTAFALEQGAIEYHNEMLLLNTVNYGLSDRFTVGAGIVALPRRSLCNLHLKLSQDLGRYIHLALGTAWGTGRVKDSFTESRDFLVRYFMPFGALALGTRRNFVNFTLGRVYVDEDGEGQSPEWIYNLNGAVRLNQRLRLFVESANSSNEYIHSYRIYNAGFGVIGKRSIVNIGNFFGKDMDRRFFPTLSYSRKLN